MIIGLIGNGLTIFVMQQSKKKKASNLLFLVLAVADSMALLSEPLNKWMVCVFNFDLRVSHFIICKVHVFLTYCAYIVATWILVLITIERMICVIFPLKAKIYITQNMIVVSIIAIVTMTISILSVNLVIYDIIMSSFGERCYVVSKYDNIYNILSWICLCFASLIPFTIIVSGNISIYLHLKRSKTIPVSNSKIKTDSINRTLFFISTYFLLATLPFFVCLVLATEPTSIWSIVQYLYYSNNAVNFFLYCFSGKTFRLEVYQLICHRK